MLDDISEEVVSTTLPMIDPHEILDYVWRTGRIRVPKEEILTLASETNISIRSVLHVLISVKEPISKLLRKYWSHMAEFTSWAAEHEGREKNSFPVSIYGDEASFGGMFNTSSPCWHCSRRSFRKRRAPRKQT